jgi:hypothetical protein
MGRDTHAAAMPPPAHVNPDLARLQCSLQVTMLSPCSPRARLQAAGRLNTPPSAQGMTFCSRISLSWRRNISSVSTLCP